MTQAELRLWAESADRTQSPVAAAVRELLQEFAALRAHSLRLTEMVPMYEQMRIELEIARAANAAYSIALLRCRAMIAARSPEPWAAPGRVEGT